MHAAASRRVRRRTGQGEDLMRRSGLYKAEWMQGNSPDRVIHVDLAEHHVGPSGRVRI